LAVAFSSAPAALFQTRQLIRATLPAVLLSVRATRLTQRPQTRVTSLLTPQTERVKLRALLRTARVTLPLQRVTTPQTPQTARATLSAMQRRTRATQLLTQLPARATQPRTLRTV